MFINGIIGRTWVQQAKNAPARILAVSEERVQEVLHQERGGQQEGDEGDSHLVVENVRYSEKCGICIVY